MIGGGGGPNFGLERTVELLGDQITSDISQFVNAGCRHVTAGNTALRGEANR